MDRGISADRRPACWAEGQGLQELERLFVTINASARIKTEAEAGHRELCVFPATVTFEFSAVLEKQQHPSPCYYSVDSMIHSI